MSDDRGKEARAILWGKLAEFEAESAAGDLPHSDLVWLTERLRQDELRIAVLEREAALRTNKAKVWGGQCPECGLKVSFQPWAVKDGSTLWDESPPSNTSCRMCDCLIELTRVSP